jgi:mono/diheme cytochrome c family protein
MMTRTPIKIVLTGSLFVLAFLLMSQTTTPVVPGQNKGALQASMTRGKKVYLEQCLTCHQADAGGVPNMAPPLIKTKWVLGDKTTLVQLVLKGMSGDVEVNGDTYRNVMAPHSELTDQQIADVLTYVRNDFGNKARAITAAEVKAIRAKTK